MSGSFDSDDVSADSDELSARLREAASASGLSRQELAQAARVSMERLQQLLVGTDVPSAREVWRLSMILDIDPTKLVPGAPMGDLGPKILDIYKRLKAIKDDYS